MADMSTLRKKLFGYKLVRATPYRDTSFDYEGTIMTELTYVSKNGHIVVKDIYGRHTLDELLGKEQS